MGPKKRDRDNQLPNGRQHETVQADHELFLQAFEKPTQIYRYLRSRNITSPIFLHRNLHYMQPNKLTTRSCRKQFTVNSILHNIEAKRKRESQTDSYKAEYMNLIFLGFFDKEVSLDIDKVEVEALLLKICHKKRKDVSSPVMQTSLGKVEVSLNPEAESVPPTEAVSIAHDNFNHNNGHSVKSYVLLLRVTCPLRTSIPNGLLNGDVDTEPICKKRKNGKTSLYEDEHMLFGSELVIYDKQKRCLLTDGEYELALQDIGPKSGQKKQATWETLLDGKSVGPFDVFNKCPTLKFKLTWAESPQSPAAMCDGIKSSHREFLKNNNYTNNHVISTNVSGSKGDSPVLRGKEANALTPKKKTRIFYQFLYNNNTRQQTEARSDLHCPWCSLNCMQLYSLVKHLRLCHARFNFMYVPHPKGARIDVSINERYDGSYVGNPQDLHSHIGYAFSRNGPVRRTPVTCVIVYKPKRPEPLLAEFLEPEGDSQVNRQFIQGHNRLYFHNVTSQPIRPQEIDYDSEDETDPLWLRQKTINMIDEFTDVNEGEKELMKLWNKHIMRHDYIADCQIPAACQKFVENHGRTIIEKNLCRNFINHMVNLFDFSLIQPEVVQQTIAQLNSLVLEMGSLCPSTMDSESSSNAMEIVLP